jgi:hypothetical protein
VSAGPLSTILEAGGCAISDGGALRSEAGGDPEIAMEDAMSCPFTVAGVVRPTDVAADLAGFPGVGPSDNFGRHSCDDPGSGCRGIPVLLPPTASDTALRRVRKISQEDPGSKPGPFPGTF